MTRLIDGKAVAKRVRAEVKEQVPALLEVGVTPTLAVVLAGEDPASAVYVRHKERACKRAGIRSIKHTLPNSCTTEDVLTVVQQLNDDPSVNGILVQLPLPKGCDESAILEAVDPKKDVDGFHPVNQGALAAGQPRFVPCTPNGVMRLLTEYDVNTDGAEVVVIGRSRIVGRPQALLMTSANATVTLCHSRTRDLAAHCRRADIIVAAVGRPEFVRGGWIKPGAVVIDVGVNRLEDGRLVGDVAFDEAQGVAGAITPVPGGVGPMTVAMLLVNTLTACRQQNGVAAS